MHAAQLRDAGPPHFTYLLTRLVGDDEQRLSLPLHLMCNRLEPRDQVDV